MTEIQPKLVPAIKEHINSWKWKWLGVFGFSYRWVQRLKIITSQDLELNYLFSGAWSGLNFMLPKNRIWTGETKQGNFKQKSLVKSCWPSDQSQHGQWQVILTICTSRCAVLGRALHFWDIFLEARDSCLITRKTSEEPKLREIPQNTWPVLCKTLIAVKNKKRTEKPSQTRGT